MQGSRSEAPESSETGRRVLPWGGGEMNRRNLVDGGRGNEAAVPSESQELLVFIMRCD